MIQEGAKTRKYSHGLFRPVTFPLLFMACYSLYLMKLSKSIQDPSYITTIYIYLSVFLYCVGIYIGGYVARHTKEKERKKITSIRAVRILWALYFVSCSFFIIEHLYFIMRFGRPPIYLSNFETLRFALPINGYIHLVAVMNYIFIYCIAVLYFYCKAFTWRRVVLVSVFFSLSMCLDLLVGNRASSIGLLAMFMIAASFYKRFTLMAVAAGFVLLFVFGAGKLFRDYAVYGDYVFQSVRSNWAFGDDILNASLFFVYVGIAENFEILNRYVLSVTEHFYGYFSILTPIYSIIPGKQYGLLELQNDVLGVDFYGILTGTFLTVLYVDYGLLGAFVCVVIGYFAGFFYSRAKSGSLTGVAIYGYFHWCIILSLYTYMFDKFYVFLNLIFIAFFFSRVAMEVGVRADAKAEERRRAFTKHSEVRHA
jgi:oligosaccharide repeat unit polymerase